MGSLLCVKGDWSLGRLAFSNINFSKDAKNKIKKKKKTY